MPPVIEVTNLRKTYGDLVAVDDVSLAVEQGEIFGIIGPNGSGKTTAVECVLGLRHPDGGAIRVLGLDPEHDRARLRQSVGAQLQQSALPDRIRVWEALDLFASTVDSPGDWRVLLEQWGLAKRRNAAYATLSGGERQRLLIALALINNPSVVFLDEMTTGLDPNARRVAWGLIDDVRRTGATVVLVTHFMDEAEHLCDRIALIRSGRLIALDTPRGLVSTYFPEARVTFTTAEPDLAFIGSVEGVRSVERVGTRVEVTGSGAVLARVAAALVARGIEPDDLAVNRATLEDVFMRLTATTETAG